MKITHNHKGATAREIDKMVENEWAIKTGAFRVVRITSSRRHEGDWHRPAHILSSVFEIVAAFVLVGDEWIEVTHLIALSKDKAIEKIGKIMEGGKRE